MGETTTGLAELIDPAAELSASGRDTSSPRARSGSPRSSPNDLVVRGADSSFYFTGPAYGRWNDWIGQDRNHVCIPPVGRDPAGLEFDQLRALAHARLDQASMRGE
jgi:hypothetical protein